MMLSPKSQRHDRLDHSAEGDTFDMAYCGRVLHHLPDPVDMLRRMRAAAGQLRRRREVDAALDASRCATSPFHRGPDDNSQWPADVPGVGAGRV
jgi:hypothetical protein